MCRLRATDGRPYEVCALPLHPEQEIHIGRERPELARGAQLQRVGLGADGVHLRQNHIAVIIRRRLKVGVRRGIDRATADEAVAALPDDEAEQALLLIEKSYRSKMDDRESRQKVMAALARRGFGYGTVKAAFALFDEERDEEPDGMPDEWD